RVTAIRQAGEDVIALGITGDGLFAAVEHAIVVGVEEDDGVVDALLGAVLDAVVVGIFKDVPGDAHGHRHGGLSKWDGVNVRLGCLGRRAGCVGGAKEEAGICGLVVSDILPCNRFAILRVVYQRRV